MKKFFLFKDYRNVVENLSFGNRDKKEANTISIIEPCELHESIQRRWCWNFTYDAFIGWIHSYSRVSRLDIVLSRISYCSVLVMILERLCIMHHRKLIYLQKNRMISMVVWLRRKGLVCFVNEKTQSMLRFSLSISSNAWCSLLMHICLVFSCCCSLAFCTLCFFSLSLSFIDHLNYNVNPLSVTHVVMHVFIMFHHFIQQRITRQQWNRKVHLSKRLVQLI